VKRLWLLLAALIALPSFAQTATAPPASNTPAPAQSSLSFNVGASAFGAGGTSATPATDVTLTLNPGLASKGYLSEISLLSDNALAPGINWQYYGGGLSAPIPVKFPSTSALSGLSFYWRGSAGMERIVPATGPSQSHVGAMIGGGASWTSASGVKVQLFEVGALITPNAAWGNKAPYFAGGISYLFGSH
jgi:hypothetical protein